MAPALRMTRSIKEKLPVFFFCYRPDLKVLRFLASPYICLACVRITGCPSVVLFFPSGGLATDVVKSTGVIHCGYLLGLYVKREQFGAC